MKTRFWILLFLSIAVVCAGLSIWLLGGKAETTAEVYSDGKLVQTIDLAVDGEYRIESGGGWNILTVSGGKIAVTSASCPTQDCVHHAAADHGAPIVCLAEPARRAVQHAVRAGCPARLDPADILRNFLQDLPCLHRVVRPHSDIAQRHHADKPPVLLHRQTPHLASRAIRRAASSTLRSGSAARTRRVMISATRVRSGSSPAATQRTTISRSVTMPRSRPSRLHTGSAPMLCCDRSRAATATVSSGEMAMIRRLMTSLTCIAVPSLIKTGLPRRCRDRRSFLLVWERGRQIIPVLSYL